MLLKIFSGLSQISAIEIRIYVWIFLFLFALLVFGVGRLYNAVVANTKYLLLWKMQVEKYNNQLKKVAEALSGDIHDAATIVSNINRLTDAFNRFIEALKK